MRRFAVALAAVALLTDCGGLAPSAPFSEDLACGLGTPAYPKGDEMRYIALIVLVLALAACGGSATMATTPAATSTVASPASQAPAASQPANPVAIVRETGAAIRPGEVYGSRDVYGGLYADGDLYGPRCTAADGCSEQVRVTTVAPGGLAGLMAEAPDAIPSDTNSVIRGQDFYISVTPVLNVSGSGSQYTWFVPPAVIAARVHGTLLTPTG
jgi:hypothetical protein